MNNSSWSIDERRIEALRGRKNKVDQHRPYGWIVEKERTAQGTIEDVAIIFLTNRECPFRCLMCDLWKNTTDETVDPGSIPEQIQWALEQLPPVRHVKLYNSGSFFDEKAIPVSDYEKIASLLRDFETVIVESHPRVLGQRCLDFKNLLKPRLEVALGLETVNSEVLMRLNKKMTIDDFRKAVSFLTANGISTRAFILLRPPFMSENQGIEWAERSIDFAFNAGVSCCTVIPVRGGNGIMDELMKEGLFSPPNLRSLEYVLEYGINLKAGWVFADVWDIELFTDCSECTEKRKERIISMNLYQEVPERVMCRCD
jgi:radical SAM enzyme (TIGR01210 family)